VREISSFKNVDLVLRVTPNIDPARFDYTKYEDFLNALHGPREYSKEAVRVVCRYLMGGAYRDQADLAEQNWRANHVLREKYPTFARFKAALPFPDRLACSVDLATGTGKSFVMYAIAQIMLAEGAVDRVLVLCPSNTIEAGLLDKFRLLAADRGLRVWLPPDAALAAPHIADANDSITPGVICIENIHATYKNTQSAITDSLTGKGDRTLVLNDEAHHIYTPGGDKGLKRWKEFLEDPTYGFRYLVGLSGTCYIGNDYFPDVVARYSLATAIEEGFVKRIEYVAEDSPGDQYERFQKIYDNHQRNKILYREVRPLTILITKDVGECRKLTERLIQFLVKFEHISYDAAAAKVLIVTSHDDHRHNVARLRAGEPDQGDSSIEWITSVSMLTEGWDVKNVFQIVPDDVRAFDSKLLIAQVLGRGLRVPPAYAGQRPMVTVFNHDNWSRSIEHLVYEVLETERLVPSFPIEQRRAYNFTLHTIDYGKAQHVVATEQESEYNFSLHHVELAGQQRELSRKTTYEMIGSTQTQSRVKHTRVLFDMTPMEVAVNEIFNKFKAVDMEKGTNYTRTYTKDWVRGLIRRSLDHIGYTGDELSKENKQRVLSAIGNLNRPGNKSIRYDLTPQTVIRLQAQDRPANNIGVGMLRRGASVFFDDISFEADPDLQRVLEEIEADGTLPRNASFKVGNSFHFRTCLSVVLTNAEPERRFVAQLVDPANAGKVDAWLKNRDTAFYQIEYSFSKGQYSRPGTFNPDFFIKIGADIVVVEIKGDEEVSEPSAENKGKRRAAIKHFDLLNEQQTEARYHFCFLTPSDYDFFFAAIHDGTYMAYQSSLDVALLS